MTAFNSRLKSLCDDRESWLCVGLDMNPEAFGSNDLANLKDHTFNVIDATRDLAVAYKPNFAFFERWGAAGFAWLEETAMYIGDDHIKIADAKRGDSIDPFLHDPEKGVFILCRTSNPSAEDFQNILSDDSKLYEKVAMWANGLNDKNNVGLVVGATAPEELTRIREISPDLSMLIPGVGAQGGDLEHSVKVGNQSSVGLINISRGISFAGDMSEKAIRSAAEEYVNKMRNCIK